MPWPVHPNGLLGAQGDNDAYRIERSLRFNSGDTAYLNRTLTTPTNNKIFTYSCWIKSNGSTARQPIFVAINGGATSLFGIEFAVTTQTLLLWDSNYSNAAPALTTSQVFRDPSAWYHIVMSVDTTQATAANRTRLYVNGSQITAFSSANYAAQNSSPYMNSAVSHSIGSWVPGVAAYASLYMTELNFIDGQALTPSSFGETDAITGRWKAKAYSGTYGNNGFYLKFADNSGTTATTLGKDSSPNGNNWTPNNFSVATTTLADKVANDSLVDSPTNYGTDTGVGGEVRGNYATLNQISTIKGTIIDGNLRTNAGNLGSISTIGMTSGKWYCEMYITALGAESSVGISQGINAMSPYVGASSDSWGYYYNGSKYNNGSPAAYGATFTTGDTIGASFDAGTGTLTFYKNGTSQGTAYTSLTSGPYYFATSGRTSTSANDVTMNFGQQAWRYAPPTGFKALCTTNLPTPTIKKPSSYFDALAYTGTGASNSISSLGFSPDLVWIKNRGGATSHALYDITRGTGAQLSSNLTDAEVTSSTGLTAFGSSGFTIGTSTLVNTSGTQYVAWAWDEAPMAGMDIVSFTGTGATQNVSHNLGVAPKMVIYKCRNTAVTSWVVGHSSVNSGSSPWNYYLVLNATDAQAASSAAWNNTAPTSAQFTVGGGFTPNTFTYIAYLFAEVEGFSKFGSYTGNGSADGPFIYCGFRPRWIVFKSSSYSGANTNWITFDTSRDSYNVMSNYLIPNTSGAEATVAYGDTLSNGFKFRYTDGNNNASGQTYIFAAFAESPFKYARAR
jgi:hypothetical protein